jgi:hypothetical protein
MSGNCSRWKGAGWYRDGGNLIKNGAGAGAGVPVTESLISIVQSTVGRRVLTVWVDPEHVIP